MARRKTKEEQEQERLEQEQAYSKEANQRYQDAAKSYADLEFAIGDGSVKDIARDLTNDYAMIQVTTIYTSGGQRLRVEPVEPREAGSSRYLPELPEYPDAPTIQGYVKGYLRCHRRLHELRVKVESDRVESDRSRQYPPYVMMPHPAYMHRF